MIDWIKEHLVPEARNWWRLASIRLNALGLLILGWVQVDPVGVLSVWNMMPAAVTRALPSAAVTWLGMSIFALSMIARLVVQPKVSKHD